PGCRTRNFSASGRSTATPSSMDRPCWTRTSPSSVGPTSLSPARSPGWRATSNPRPLGCSRLWRWSRGCGAFPLFRLRGKPRSVRCGGLDRRERGARRETSGGDAVRIGYGLLVVALALAACKKAEPPPYQGKGRAIYRGPAREVIVAPDGGAIGWIADPVQAKEKGTNAPDHVYVGRATYDTGSGDPVTLGDGVATTTKVGTFFFSPTGDHVGALTEWSFAHGEGTLVVGSTRGKGVRRVAPKVSFFAFSRDGKWLGYVSDGKFLVEPADGGQPVELTAEVATFEFSPDSQWVLARKRSVVGGQLMLARRDGADPARPLASRVNEYKWSPDGRRIAYTTRGEEGGSDLFVLDINGTARRVGKGVPTFAFSPRAKHLAFIGDTSP